MAQARETRQEELGTKIAQWVEAQQLGTPTTAFVMEATIRYYFRWFLLLLGCFAAVFSVVMALTLKTLLSVILGGFVLVAVALMWMIYFSAPFRRYSQQHTTHFYICPNGMVGVLGDSILYTYHWAQVQAISLKEYKGGSEYKLQLVDGRQFIFKGMYQPPIKGLSSAIEGAWESYRGKPQG